MQKDVYHVYPKVCLLLDNRLLVVILPSPEECDEQVEKAVDLSYSVFMPDNKLSSSIPAIILHGLLGSKQNWRSLGKAIAVRSSRKVYALDARNHGDSPHSYEFNYELMSADVKHFMNSQAISSAILIGHSMGGRTAMHLALTEKSLVNKLVVVDVSPISIPQALSSSIDYMTAMKEAIKTVPKLGIVQARKAIDIYLSRSIPEIGIRQFLLTNLHEENKVLKWRANLEVLSNCYSELMRFPSVLGHYLEDTLFICGEDSPYVKSEDYPQIRILFAKAEFAVIPGAGHWVHSEKPSEFLEILLTGVETVGS
ncbi:protein ABHD11-like isoform X2 [Stegodyphus dumicola]|uniref:protein ABHD11-like isoform X2 n=1 Tax=Stegodyphus dumicola TaxID=202533 RepID=UPI0015AF9F8F|nr:protein ABHD11-like isoform X2 [Stegodyphus dumicola]